MSLPPIIPPADGSAIGPSLSASPALASSRWKGPRRNLAAAAAAALALLSASAWLIAREARRVGATPITSWSGEPLAADCAIVLTGGPGRVREGFDLLARKQAQKLIVSGVHPQAELREIFPLWPFYSGVRPEDVALERRSRTTFGNAQQSLPLAEALRCRDAWLVTSRVHMYRALKTFRAEFPSGLRLYPRAVVWGSADPTLGELASETGKSLFYSLWAY